MSVAELVQQLREVMKEYGLTQMEVAQAIGAGQTSVSRWLRSRDSDKVAMEPEHQKAVRKLIAVYRGLPNEDDLLLDRRAKLLAADEMDRVAAKLRAEARSSAVPGDGTDAVNRAYSAAKAEADKERRLRERKRKGGAKADGESA